MHPERFPNRAGLPPPGPFRLSTRHQAWVFGTAGALAVSGVAWLALHYGWPADEFGGRNPLEAWCLRVHGLATMLFLAVAGALVPNHITRAWAMRRNRWSGTTISTAVVTLALTGYMLYYAGDETLRPSISVIHWGIGLIGVPALTWHVIAGRRRAVRSLRLRRTEHGHRRGPSHAAPQAHEDSLR